MDRRSRPNLVTTASNGPGTGRNSHMHIQRSNSNNSRNQTNSVSKFSKGSRGSRSSKASKGILLTTNFNGEQTLDDAFKHSFYNPNMMNTGDNRSNRSPFGVTIGKRNNKVGAGSRNGSKQAFSSGKSRVTASVKSNSSKTYQIHGADLSIIQSYNEGQA